MKSIISAAFLSFLVPEKELSLKLFADNFRTLGVSLAFLVFTKQFKVDGLGLLVPYCTKHLELCKESIAAGDVFYQLPNLLITCVAMASTTLAITFLILAFIQALAIGNIAITASSNKTQKPSDFFVLAIRAFTCIYAVLAMVTASGVSWLLFA
ncbi:MAG: hypothetical protein Q8M09_12270 [Pseudomonadota bacterium]|nr:hypothetical protein [Pseudomonadota bacterium]MDP1905004.1 hypothetical protein [Pseudomonadota bacterium]